MDLRFDCGDIYILKDNFDKLKKNFLDYNLLHLQNHLLNFYKSKISNVDPPSAICHLER